MFLNTGGFSSVLLEQRKEIKMKELISIIVPIYNVEKYLECCVKSILNQTYTNIEVILVDDGSTDQSYNICEKFKQTDCRIKVLHKVYGGVSTARNAGIDVARGEYISFVDSDDYISEDMIHSLYDRAKETQADLAFCGFNAVEEDGAFKRSEEVEDKTFDKNSFWDYKYNKHPVACTVVWNKLYKRRIFENLRFPVGRIHEDSIILPAVIEQCNIIATTQKGKYMYRQRNGSIMHTKYTLANFKIINERFEMVDYFQENNQLNLVKKAMEIVVFELKNGYANLDFSKPEIREEYRKQIDYLKKKLKKIGRKNFGFGENVILTICLMLPVNTKIRNIILAFKRFR